MNSKIVRLFRWVFGIVFAFAGIGYLFSHVLPGIICLLIAAILLPPVIMFIQRQFRTVFPRKYKIIALVILFILLIVVVPRTPTNDIDFKNIDTKTPLPEQLQNNSQPASPETLKTEPPEVVKSVSDEIKSSSYTPPPDVMPISASPAAVSSTLPKTAAPAPATTPPPATTYKQPAAAPESGCDPNYSGCVPIASDVDCANGSGDGPVYVTGPITVTDNDHYRLDGDHDGIACDK